MSITEYIKSLIATNKMALRWAENDTDSTRVSVNRGRIEVYQSMIEILEKDLKRFEEGEV